MEKLSLSCLSVCPCEVLNPQSTGRTSLRRRSLFFHEGSGVATSRGVDGEKIEVKLVVPVGK